MIHFFVCHHWLCWFKLYRLGREDRSIIFLRQMPPTVTNRKGWLLTSPAERFRGLGFGTCSWVLLSCWVLLASCHSLGTLVPWPVFPFLYPFLLNAFFSSTREAITIQNNPNIYSLIRLRALHFFKPWTLSLLAIAFIKYYSARIRMNTTSIQGAKPSPGKQERFDYTHANRVRNSICKAVYHNIALHWFQT